MAGLAWRGQKVAISRNIVSGKDAKVLVAIQLKDQYGAQQ